MPRQINKNAFVQRLRARFKKAHRQTNNKNVFVGGLRARMKIQEGLEKMATEKTLINHLRGLKITIRPNPKVEPNNAKISLNINDYASFEKEKKEGTKYMRELARLERCSKIDAGIEKMSKASLLFSLGEWASKGISLSRHSATMGGDSTKEEIIKSAFGMEEEGHIQELEGMLSTADMICRNLDIIESSLLAEKRAKVKGGKGEKKEKDDEKRGNGEKDKDDDKGIKADSVKKEGEDGNAAKSKDSGSDGDGDGDGLDVPISWL
ncbi:hypothetical protein ACH5RR_008028 [Cinchona calisaya]|uniref:Uncharacterized protein n=1 Tax=Cinchona calisaya TaxID=153742 RepID=A0ABD3AA73_9GENT